MGTEQVKAMNKEDLRTFLESERRRGGLMGRGKLREVADAVLAMLKRRHPGELTARPVGEEEGGGA